MVWEVRKLVVEILRSSVACCRCAIHIVEDTNRTVSSPDDATAEEGKY